MRGCFKLKQAFKIDGIPHLAVLYITTPSLCRSINVFLKLKAFIFKILKSILNLSIFPVKFYFKNFSSIYQGLKYMEEILDFLRVKNLIFLYK